MMKYRASPVAYPTSKEDEVLWGFDILKPVGVPKAWIHDWSSAFVGFQMPMQTLEEFLSVIGKVQDDLSKFTVDELYALSCLNNRIETYERLEKMEKIMGKEKTLQIQRELGKSRGNLGWMNTQARYGSPVPLDKIAFFQDLAHLLYGPNMQTNTWFDDEKVVCSRTSCTFAPPAGRESYAVYCLELCGGMTNAYMECEPTLLSARLVDIGEDGKGRRCVHVWTYKPEVFEKVPKECLDNIPETAKSILRQRGVKI